MYFAAPSQLKSLQKRLSNDIQLKDMYKQTLTTDLQKFYVEPVGNAAARTRENLIFASSPGGYSKQARKSAQSSKCCGQV